MTLPDTTSDLIEEVQRLGNVGAALDKALRDISTHALLARANLKGGLVHLTDLHLQSIQETLILCGIPQYSDDAPEVSE